MALKGNPCFHRTISIQIDSPLPRMTLKQFQDNLMFLFIIKALQISYSTSSVCDFWIALKNRTPCFHRPFQFRLTVHYPRMTLKQFQDNLMLYYIIKLSKSHILPDLSLILIGSKNKSPCFHRSILIQIDSPLPQDGHSSSLKTI